jgi:hypothetical protein
MFLSEWRIFPSASCLAAKNIDDSSRLDVAEIVPDMLPSLFPLLDGLRIYQHPGNTRVGKKQTERIEDIRNGGITEIQSI